MSCVGAARAAHAAGILANQVTANALDPTAIRLVTWNIHKEADAGWQQDLTHFAQANDVVLLQETALLDSLREILHENGLRWVMASSFIYGDADMRAARSLQHYEARSRAAPTVELHHHWGHDRRQADAASLIGHGEIAPTPDHAQTACIATGGEA